MLKTLFKNKSLSLFYNRWFFGTLFLLFSLSFSAQVYLSGSSQIYIGNDVEFSGDVRTEANAKVYISKEVYIANSENLAHAEVVILTNDNVADNNEASKKIAQKEEVKEKKKIAATTQKQTSHLKIKKSDSDAKYVKLDSISKTSVSPSPTDLISKCDNTFVYWSSTIHKTINSNYKFLVSISENNKTFSIRPPPSVI